MKKGNKNKELTTIIIFFGRLYEYSIRNKDLFVKTHKKCTLFSFCWLFFDEFANGQICFCFFLTLPISCWLQELKVKPFDGVPRYIPDCFCLLINVF